MSEVIWSPQERQRLVITAPFDEILYGGAAGGGKTDCLIGDWLAHSQRYGKDARGVLFRNSFPELMEIQRRMEMIYGAIGGRFKEKDMTWTFPSGATQRLSYLDSFDDALKHRGHEYCVAVGTPVLMAGGVWKPIEDIQVGDYVSTLNGPKKVDAVHHPGVKYCVKAELNIGGARLSQIHPATHPILLESGKTWASYASLIGSGRTDGDMLHELTGNVVRALCTQTSVRTQVVVSLEAFHNLPASTLGKPSQSREMKGSCSEFEDSSKECGKHQTSRSTEKQDHGQRSLHQSSDTWIGSPDGASYARNGIQKALDSQSHYSSCSHLGGELLHPPSGIVQGLIPSQDGGLGQTCSLQSKMDEMDTTGIDTHNCPLYWSHRYHKTEQMIGHCVGVASCEMSPFGMVDVYDLTVADNNHYITSSCLVNSNTWRGHDELTMRPTDEEYVFLESRMRSSAGVPCRTISTSNPGGPGHSWVMKRFKIDHYPKGMTPIHDYFDVKRGFIMERGEASIWDEWDSKDLPPDIRRKTRIFIPGRLADNKYLDTDGMYRSKLLGMPEAQRKMLLEGRWDVVEGAFFDEWNPISHIIPARSVRIGKDWKKIMGMDWGTTSPYAVVWMAQHPHGHWYVYRELYGCKPDKNNEGLREAPSVVAERILALEEDNDEYISERYLDASCFDNKEMGTSVSEQLRQNGVYCQPSQKKFKSGSIALFRDWLKVVNGVSRIQFLDCCVNLIRTIPALQINRHNVEQYDTDGEDHLIDALIYAIRRNIKTREELNQSRGVVDRNKRILKRYGAYGAQ